MVPELVAKSCGGSVWNINSLLLLFSNINWNYLQQLKSCLFGCWHTGISISARIALNFMESKFRFSGTREESVHHTHTLCMQGETDKRKCISKLSYKLANTLCHLEMAHILRETESTRKGTIKFKSLPEVLGRIIFGFKFSPGCSLAVGIVCSIIGFWPGRFMFWFGTMRSCIILSDGTCSCKCRWQCE